MISGAHVSTNPTQPGQHEVNMGRGGRSARRDTRPSSRSRSSKPSSMIVRSAPARVSAGGGGEKGEGLMWPAGGGGGGTLGSWLSASMQACQAAGGGAGSVGVSEEMRGQSSEQGRAVLCCPVPCAGRSLHGFTPAAWHCWEGTALTEHVVKAQATQCGHLTETERAQGVMRQLGPKERVGTGMLDSSWNEAGAAAVAVGRLSRSIALVAALATMGSLPSSSWAHLGGTSDRKQRLIPAHFEGCPTGRLRRPLTILPVALTPGPRPSSSPMAMRTAGAVWAISTFLLALSSSRTRGTWSTSVLSAAAAGLAAAGAGGAGVP